MPFRTWATYIHILPYLFTTWESSITSSLLYFVLCFVIFYLLNSCSNSDLQSIVPLFKLSSLEKRRREDEFSFIHIKKFLITPILYLAGNIYMATVLLVLYLYNETVNVILLDFNRIRNTRLLITVFRTI